MELIPDYFFVDGASEQHGPVEPHVMMQYWLAGSINETTFVFAADGSMPNWALIPDVPELHGLCLGKRPGGKVPLPPPLPPTPPPAPNPPPMAAAPAPPAVNESGGGGDRGALLSSIQSGIKLKKTPAPDEQARAPAAAAAVPSGGGGGRGDLLADIASGVKLRSAAARGDEPKPMPKSAPKGGGANLFDELAAGVNLRAKKMQRESRLEQEEVAEARRAAAEKDGPLARVAAGGSSMGSSLGATLEKAAEKSGAPAGAEAKKPPLRAGSTAPPEPAPAVSKSLVTWQPRVAPEGQTYYYNPDTGETQWEKPDELKSEAERAAEGAWLWLPSTTAGFEAVKVVSARSNDGSFLCEPAGGGARRRVDGKEAKRAVALNPSHLERACPDDLVMLPAVNEAMILHTLERRFASDQIFTSIGSILVSVNPFKPLPLFTPTQMSQYATRGSTKLPPHIYQVADTAYRGVLFGKKSQSIVISGESGAGKTEATKLCLSYLASVAGSSGARSPAKKTGGSKWAVLRSEVVGASGGDEASIEQRVLQANPILEAFGNAKTIRNNNSSRFGKLVEVSFDNTCRIVSAHNLNYLLEKSRVVTQAPDERNYHVFYQLLAGAWTLGTTARERLKLEGTEAKQYRLLASSGCFEIAGVDDSAELTTMLSAMALLDISESEIDSVVALVGALLHVGQIEFRRTRSSIGEGSAYHEGCAVVDWDPLFLAAELLELDVDAFHKCIVFRSVRVGGAAAKSIDDIPLSTEQAVASRNALAKMIYTSLFDWLVERINASLNPDYEAAAGGLSVAVLDIFGFEIFGVNSFEQLLINFTNEKLQRHFNAHVFMEEERLYEAEGIQYGKTGFVDNQPLLDLLEKKLGLFSTLDEQVAMPGGSDSTFIEKLAVNHPSSPYLSIVGYEEFSIVHYAGKVTYQTSGFLEKNGDKLLDDQRAVMLESGSKHIVELFSEPPRAKKGPVGGQRTIASRFSKQLDDLMLRLDATSPQFVRCIKPNALKAAGVFERTLCLQQLQYSGVFEATAITKAGFPFRYTHEAFVQRYRCLVPAFMHGAVRKHLASRQGGPRPTPEEWSEAARELVPSLPSGLPGRLNVGRTMLLYRVAEHEVLELLRNLAVEARLVVVQTHARGRLARLAFAKAAEARAACVAAIASRELGQLQAAVALASTLPLSYSWAREAQAMCAQLAAENRMRILLRNLTTQDAESVFESLSAALDDAEALGAAFAEEEAALLGAARAMVLRVTQRREARAALRQIIDGEALRAGLALARESGLWDGQDPSSAATAEDREALQAAVSAAAKIDAEERRLEELRAVLFGEGRVEWDDAHEPLLQRVSTGPLQAALDESVQTGARSKDGIFLHEAARAVLGMRRAVIAAGAGEWSDAAKHVVDKVLEASVPLHDQVPELVEAAKRVAVRAAVQDTVALLEQAVGVLHHEALKMALMRAAAVGDEAMAAFAGLVSAGRALDAKLDSIRDELKLGVREVSLERLRPALVAAAEVDLAHYEQPAAAALALQLESLLPRIGDALSELRRDEMEACLGEADTIGLRSADIETTRKYLAMPLEKFLVEELKVAVQLRQEDRQDELQMRIKLLFFERTDDMFAIAKYPRLRSVDEFASRGKNKREAREVFLRFQKRPVPTSLTQLEKGLREEALLTFRCVLEFMGDAGFCHPLMVAQELIRLALLGGVSLQGEVYVQIVKQLTDNPSEASRRLGWQLLTLVMQCFPPDTQLENYLACFLYNSSASPETYLRLMFAGARVGPCRQPPRDVELPDLLTAAEEALKPAKDRKPIQLAPHQAAELAIGTRCRYTTSEGKQVVAVVVKVHYDDPPPYYTISIDGHERSTIRSRLTPFGESARSSGGLPPDLPDLPDLPDDDDDEAPPDLPPDLDDLPPDLPPDLPDDDDEPPPLPSSRTQSMDTGQLVSGSL